MKKIVLDDHPDLDHFEALFLSLMTEVGSDKYDIDYIKSLLRPYDTTDGGLAELTRAQLDNLGPEGRTQLVALIMEQYFIYVLERGRHISALETNGLMLLDEVNYDRCFQQDLGIKAPEPLRSLSAAIPMIDGNFLGMFELSLGILAQKRRKSKIPPDNSKLGRVLDEHLRRLMVPGLLADLQDAPAKLRRSGPSGRPSMTSLLLAVRAAMMSSLTLKDPDKDLGDMDRFVMSASVPFFLMLYVKAIPYFLWSGIIKGTSQTRPVVKGKGLFAFEPTNYPRMGSMDNELDQDNVITIEDKKGMTAKKGKPKDVGAIDVLTLKVQFKDRPKVFRVLKMSSDSTLVELHEAIQASIGWAGDHMYAFYMSGKAYDDDTEYYPDYPEEDWPAHPGKDAKIVRLDSPRLGLKVGSKFLYLFDFGDDHRFGVEVLEIQKDVGLSRKDLPMLVERKGKAPQQY